MTRTTTKDYIAPALKPEKLRVLKLQGYHPCQEPRCPMLVPGWKDQCTQHWKQLTRFRSSKRIRTQQEPQA